MGKRGWGMSLSGRNRMRATTIERIRRNGYMPTPEHIEWLMGFPIGWTELEDSATLSFPPVLNTLADVLPNTIGAEQMLATIEPAYLTQSEQEELLDHESIIEQSQAVFVEVGNALMAIRDAKLYRATHTSFEAYLAARWPNISKRRGYQLIDAAAVETDVAKRKDIVRQALQEEREQVHHIPLHRQFIPWAMRSNVEAVHRADNWLEWQWVTVGPAK